MDNSTKSPAQIQFEKALDIASSFDDKDVAGDDIAKKRAESNINLAKKLADTLEKARNSSDEEFSKKILREIAEVGLSSVRILESELQMTGDYKVAESLGSVINSVTATVKGLKDFNNDKEYLELEKQKVDLKKQLATKGSINVTQNNVFVGSTSELQKKLAELKTKTIETVVEVINNEDVNKLN